MEVTRCGNEMGFHRVMMVMWHFVFFKKNYVENLTASQ